MAEARTYGAEQTERGTSSGAHHRDWRRALGVFSVTNFVYHVVRKPTEMFFP